MLRHRKNTIDKVVQKMDAFTKVPEDYVEPSISGALGLKVRILVNICFKYHLLNKIGLSGVNYPKTAHTYFSNLKS